MIATGQHGFVKTSTVPQAKSKKRSGTTISNFRVITKKLIQKDSAFSLFASYMTALEINNRHGQ